MAMRPDGGYNAAPQPATAPVPNVSQVVAQAQQNLASGHGTLGDQSTVMNGSAANLVAAAGSGFKLDPEAATALIASCDEAIRVIEEMDLDIMRIREAPKLGGTNTAKVVSAFTHQVANDPQGIVNGIMNLKATIIQMRQAYRKAAANYQLIEQQVADSVIQLDHEVRQQQSSSASQHGRNRAI